MSCGVSDIRDCAIMRATLAICLSEVRADQPVARTQFPIGAEAITSPGIGKCAPLCPVRPDGRERLFVGNVSQVQSTEFTRGVLEIKQVLALLALKDFQMTLEVSG